MGVVVRKNFTRLRDIQLVTAADMRDVGDLLIERIKDRTLRGQDAQGQSFRGYSSGYAKQKSQAVGTSRVDLQVSGEMLNAMQVIEATDRKVTIGFIR